MPTLKSGTGTPRQDIQAAIALAPMDFVPIGTRLFPNTRAPHKRGNIGIIPVEALTSNPADIRRSAKSGSTRGNWQYEDHSYACTTYSFEEPVTQEDEEFYATMFDAQVVAAARSRMIVLRAQEVRVQALVHATGTFTGATNTLSVGTPWSTAASADPIGDIATGREAIRAKCGMTPNVLQVSYKGWGQLSRTDQIRQTLKYTDQPAGLIPLSGLAKALGIDEVLVPGDGNILNASKEGQTAAPAEIWPSNRAFLCYSPKGNSDPRMPCIGRTWFWEGGGGPLLVDEYIEPQTESLVTRVKQCTHEDLISTLFGFLYTNL